MRERERERERERKVGRMCAPEWKLYGAPGRAQRSASAHLRAPPRWPATPRQRRRQPTVHRRRWCAPLARFHRFSLDVSAAASANRKRNTCALPLTAHRPPPTSHRQYLKRRPPVERLQSPAPFSSAAARRRGVIRFHFWLICITRMYTIRLGARCASIVLFFGHHLNLLSLSSDSGDQLA